MFDNDCPCEDYFYPNKPEKKDTSIKFNIDDLLRIVHETENKPVPVRFLSHVEKPLIVKVNKQVLDDMYAYYSDEEYELMLK